MRTPAIRRLRRDDAQGCKALHATAFHRSWDAAEFVTLIDDSSVLAEGAFTDEGAILAFVLSRLAADEAEILTIVVARKARRSGLGRTLLEAHRRHLVERGIAALYLEVAEDNAAALALYAGMGFAQVGERKAYYAAASGERHRALIYVWRGT